MTIARDRCGLAFTLAGSDHDVLLLSALEDVRWCTGFTGSNGWLVISRESTALLTDGRYTEQARAEVPVTIDVVECRSAGAMVEALGRVASSGKIAVQEADLTVSTWRLIAKTVGRRLAPASGELADLRRAKTDGEISIIRRAARIADDALASCIELLRPGSSERLVRDALESRMRELGADGPSYDTIVAGGPINSARPHHRPTERTFQAADSIVVDVGALVDGYHSDMTRTFFVGEPAPEMLVWYDTLLEAQSTAIDLVEPGRAVREIDAACREVLTRAGFAEYFTHGLGHGVGLLIHENPYINQSATAVLRPGDVVTIEPGLYRGGLGGMRIEDLILVTESSHENLTSSPKDPRCPR